MNERLREAVKLFNAGYLKGHEDTVEGVYVDVHRCDVDTYHEDIVQAALAEPEECEHCKQLEAKIRQMNKDYGCELRDPNGTIWDHAARLQKELDELKKGVGK